MSRLTLDPQLRAKLNGLNEQMEVCDESGKTLGHFVPDAMYKKLIYAWANNQVTDEELDRVSQETGGSTLEEVWKRLGRT